jgi:hypothetical protein
VHVQRLIDAFLAESGHEGLREDKDYKFLKHDLRMYAGDLPYRDEEWLRAFAAEVTPYLDTLSPAAFARLPRTERVVVRLVRDGRFAEARWAARGLGHAVAPRETTEDATGRYWGAVLPDTDDARRELDVTDLELDSRPFPSALFRHEIRSVAPGPGLTLDLAVRTYDPGLRLPVGPQKASVLVTPGRHRLTAQFRLDPVRPGVFEGRVRLDLAAARLPLQGFGGVRHPLLRLHHQGLTNTGVLLAPLSFPALRATVHGTLPHALTVEPEGRGAGRLQLRWTPVGPAARVLPPLARRLSSPRLRRAARLVRGVLR